MTLGFRHSACCPANAGVTRRLEEFLFQHRAAILILSTPITLLLAFCMLRLDRDTDFEKFLPTRHPYMQTYLEQQREFGGANRVLIAVRARTATFSIPASSRS
jgi:predicted RND superfamily exporter protein